LFDLFKTLPADHRSAFGQEVNTLRQELEGALAARAVSRKHWRPSMSPAPWDVNVQTTLRPAIVTALNGSQHPLMADLIIFLIFLPDGHHRCGRVKIVMISICSQPDFPEATLHVMITILL